MLQAQFAGVMLHVRRIEEVFDRTVIEHAYPNRDGVEFEDLGRQARRFSLEITIFGDAWLADTQALRDAIDAGDGEFQHPTLGIFRGRLRDARLSQVDRQAQRLDLNCTFVEGETATSAFASGISVPAAASATNTAAAAVLAVAATLET